MSKNRLIILINTLNKSEKRYFKQYLNLYSSNNQNSIFAKLFNYILKNPNCNKEIILMECDFLIPGQYQNVSARLYHYILKSLRAYYSESSIEITCNELMINYEILLNKALHNQCWKLLLGAEKLADSKELYIFLEEVLIKKEYLATLRLKDKKVKEIIADIHRKRKSNRSAINAFVELTELREVSYSIFKKEGRVLRSLNGIELYSEKIKFVENSIVGFDNSLKISLELYRELAYIKMLTGKFDEASPFLEKSLLLFSDSSLIKDNLNSYLKLLNLYAINLNMSRDFELSIDIIDKIYNLNLLYNKSKEIQLLAFETANFQKLEIFIQKFDFEEASQFADSIIEKMDKIQGGMHTVNIQSKYYRLALSYFGNKQYREALKWINNILDFDQIKYRRDILSSVSLLNLLIHYKLDNYNLLTSRLVTSEAFLKKIDRWLPLEKTVISSLKKIVIKGESKEHVLKQFIEDLKMNEVNNPLEKYGFAYFDLKKWIILETKQL